ncbi:ESF1 protein, partial [Trichinella spiralis]
MDKEKVKTQTTR